MRGKKMDDPNQIGITIAIAIVVVAGITACTLTILYGIGVI
jgi:hypothetical protein|tara:strand:- start:369 stop:491 length:123 start_codon:yes stop_codon:yes gene_type:complete